MDFLPKSRTTSSILEATSLVPFPPETEPPSKRSGLLLSAGALLAAGLILALCLGRILAAYLLRRHLADLRAQWPDYEVSYQKVVPEWLRFGYRIEGLQISQVNAHPVGALAANQVSVSVPWNHVLRGRFQAHVWGQGIRLLLPVDLLSDQPPAAAFPLGFLRPGRPLELWFAPVQEVEIDDADLLFYDVHRHAVPSLSLYEARLRLRQEQALQLDLVAQLVREGRLAAHVVIDPSANRPTFDVKIDVRGFDLAALPAPLRPKLKNWLQEGTLNLYAEGMSRNGVFQGYAKPTFRHVDLRAAEPEAPASWHFHITRFFGGWFKPAAEGSPVARPLAMPRVPLRGTFPHGKMGPWLAVHHFVNQAVKRSVQAGAPGDMRRWEMAKSHSQAG